VAHESSTPGEAQAAGAFAPTRWSLVAAAQGRSEPARAALSELCQLYWYPLYAYLRRRGCSESDAQDQVQGFFADLLEREALSAADPARGRFRSFLLASLANHASHERQRAQALKRGGGVRPLSIDWLSAEERYRLEPADADTPERAFERAWAAALLERTLARLEAEFEAKGRGTLFRALRERIGDANREAPDTPAVRALKMNEQALRVTLHRLRKRYREILREEIAQTVASPADVEEELRALFETFSR
jgi:DNA-directed RNA polymerase specialized sigma24 family protein